MDKRNQLIKQIQDTFTEVHGLQDGNQIMILMSQVGDGQAEIMTTAPHPSAAIHLQTAALAQQLNQVEGDPEAIKDLREGSVIAFAGMLGIDVTDEFFANMRKVIEDTRAQVAAQAQLDEMDTHAPIQ